MSQRTNSTTSIYDRERNHHNYDESVQQQNPWTNNMQPQF